MVAITPTNSFAAQAEYTSSQTRDASSSIYETAKNTDKVSISLDARSAFETDMANQAMLRDSYKDKEKEKGDGPAWLLASGLETGEFTLKNGNVQKVSIEDDVLTIEEFQDGKLIKSVTGTVTKDGAVLDTEYYDSTGKLSQSIHTEMSTMEAEQGWTAAVMTRDVKWYEGGKARGEMHDQMQLRTWNLNGDHDEETAAAIGYVIEHGIEEVDTDVDALLSEMTVEKHAADYFAQIKEYGTDGSTLARDIIVEQSGRYKQYSNRSEERAGGLEARTTTELEHKTALRVEIKEYDEEGDLVKESRFSDHQQDKVDTADGKQEQTMDVSWYNKGELVKRSHGAMVLEETLTKGLPDRPGFLELFGMDDEEYLGEGPKSAIGHMATKLMTSSGEADFYTEGLAQHINDHDYNTAKGIAEHGPNGRPYSISWTDEIYSEGELVMRQKDTEGARETSYWQRERGMLFRKGAALTENDTAVVLRESSHEQEFFENGRTTERQAMKAREWIDLDMDGPDELRTTSTYEQGTEGHEVVTIINGEGGIDEADPAANAAAEGYANETDQTMMTLYATLRSLNDGQKVDKALDYRVDFDFAGNMDD